MALIPERMAPKSMVNCAQSTYDVLHEQLTRMFNYDFPDNSQVSDAPYSEDKQVPQKAETSITKLNGHYQRKLQSTNVDVILPDNRLTVENRSVLKVTFSCFESHKDKRDWLTVGCARQEPAGCKPHPVRLIGGKSSPACVSYALRKVADETETHISSETVLRVKKRIDVDDCLISENSVDDATQTVNELHCFCDPSAVGYRAVYYIYLVCVFAIHCSLAFERHRVACRFEFCTVRIAFKVSRLVVRSVTKELELRTIWEIMPRSVKKIVHYLCSRCCNSDDMITTFSRLVRHYSILRS